ncbi:MAG: 5-formyltetrahydrofolate cyclo-ligase [Alphaproteobacteria bacterium]
MSVSTDKATLRQSMKQARAALSDAARAAAAQGLLDHVVALREMISGKLINDSAGVVAGYAPLGDEVDPHPLMTALRDHGAQTALPVMTGKEQPLIFRAWDGRAPLLVGDFGVGEPAATAATVTPSVILTPLLAADRFGGRLGYGGGFYDRTIADLKQAGRHVTVIGLAYRDQLVDKVPADELDQRLDAVLTPDGLIEIG